MIQLNKKWVNSKKKSIKISIHKESQGVSFKWTDEDKLTILWAFKTIEVHLKL